VLAAPFVQLAMQGRVAADDHLPKRLVIFHSPNGTVHRFWRPDVTGDQFSFREGGILEPLAAIQDELVLVDGLDFYTGNNHEGGARAMLTNVGALGSESEGKSLDQFVAGRIGQDSRFPSLEFGVITDIWGTSTQTRISYSGPDQVVTPEASPSGMYRKLFGDAIGDADEVARIRARRLSVLDLNRAEINDLHRRLGRAEQIKLDAHLTALRRVERGISATLEGCSVPPPYDRLDANANDNAPEILERQMDLAMLALVCDMTRVVTIQFSHTVSPVVFNWVGNSAGHHSLSHASDSDTVPLQQFIDAERWVAGQFGALVQRLQTTMDPMTNRPLLDDTVVLWAKEMGDSRAHTCLSVPFVLAGGGGLWRKGRYLNLGGASHSHLLVSMCHAMGIDVNTFGDPNTGSGPLPGLV
jgi:hypothetical protein